MSVAVVIPLFNGQSWIRKTLETVLAQSLIPREIIIVDDGSEDTSVETVRSFPEVTLFRNPHKGTHHARQFGFEQTQSKYITFLDQDDILHPQHLEFLVNLLQNYPDTSAAFSQTLTFSCERRLKFPPPRLKPKIFDPWDSFPFHQIDTPSFVLIRRAALEAIGGWPTDNAWTSDVQAWFKLSLVSPMVKNASATAAYRVHHREATSYQWRLKKAHEYFLNVHKVGKSLGRDRIRLYPEESEKRHSQGQILRPMANFIKALDSLDPVLLKSTLIDLDITLSLREEHERINIKNLTVDTLIWYLQPRLESKDPDQLRGLIKTLHQGQPDDIKFVGKLIPFHQANEFPTSVLINYLRSEPWELRGWFYLVRYRGLATAIKRIKRWSLSLLGGSWPLKGYKK